MTSDSGREPENGPLEAVFPERIFAYLWLVDEGDIGAALVREAASDVEYIRADAAERVIRERVARDLEADARRLWPPNTIITDRHVSADHDGYRRAAAFVRSRNEGAGKRRVEVATFGTCGRSWNDADVSAVTPAPAARCPFEYRHTKAEGGE